MIEKPNYNPAVKNQTGFQQVRNRLMPSQHFFSSRGLQLSYLDWGNPGAPVLVLLHGGLEHAHAWDQVAITLSTDWHVIAPDLRGHGDSDCSTGSAYSTFDFVPDLVALTDKLDIKTFTLVGHSLGGNIAINYTAIYPEKVDKLCAIEGLGLSPKAREERDKKTRQEQFREWADRVQKVEKRQPRRYTSVEEATERIMQHDKLVDRDTAYHSALHGLRKNADGGYYWKYDKNINAWGTGDVATPESSDLWAAIECEVLLIYGAESWASNPLVDGRAKHFRNAQVVLVENAGHNVHHHQPDTFLAHLQSFLSS